MSKWHYPDVIRRLRISCDDFLNGNISVSTVQSEIYSAEKEIVAVDEQWLRQIMFDAENNIELLIFTVDEERLRDEVIPIVQNILNKTA
jgi:hypothetical protein